MDRTRILAIIVIVIVVVGAVGFYFTTKPAKLSVSVGTSTSVGTAGSPITFTAIPSLSSASISSVVWNFGDGVNETVSGATTTHNYANGGRYLVLAQVTATYQSFLFSSSVVGSNSIALFQLTVEPSLAADQAGEASVPTINFPSATNPTAPVFNAGDVLHPVGGFLEEPTNSNWTIQEYVWDYGNGNKQTVAASNDTSDPVENVTVSYPTPGIYPLSLTLTTVSSGETFSVTTMRTIAVQSSTLPFALLTTSSGVLNPGVITSAEVYPGGPASWDPQVDYEITGHEELENIFQTLVKYNGSSTVSFIPYLAAALPTQGSGGISPDYKTYTFQIRNDQYFSNGDPVTAYDVWFSFARGIAFAGGSPGTGDFVEAQYLIPGVQNGTATIYANNTWAAATHSVTYDNATNTVTFHFNRPMTPTLVFQVLSYSQAAGIVDARYAWSVGAGFNPASMNETTWDNYKNQANSGSYNTQMQWSPVGSGPFMVQSYTPGQSVELVPNPHYGGVPGIPKQNTTVIIDWVKTPDTALLMLQDGTADSAFGLPPSDFPLVQKLQSQGIVNIYNFPSLTLWYYDFNIKIDKELEASVLGPGFNEPSNYFADLPTRLAWINSYDYAGYLNNILGNAKYGATFGYAYQGLIPAGMQYFVPPDQLGGLPAQNLNAARGNFSISAWHDQKITIPIVIWTGDPTDVAAMEEWAGTLAQISGGNVTAKVMQNWSIYNYFVQDGNPMGVCFDGWTPDHPDPAAMFDGVYLEGGVITSGLNLLGSNFASLPPSTPYDVVHVNGSTYTQAQVWRWMQGNITLGDTSLDPAVRQAAYETANRLAIAMGLHVYVYQWAQFWYFRSWLKGYEMNENPTIGGQGALSFYWLQKE